MSADTLRRLRALRGLTRVGSTHTVLAAVQGDLQTVIEAVLELAACGEDIGDEEPCPCVLRSAHDGEHACLCENTPALPATAPEDENTPPASQDAPQGARSADSGTGGPPEPENGAQGRIGWLRLRPTSVGRYLAQETPGGWTDADLDDDLVWPAKDWPDAEFTPIRTLADDEVAVKRGDLRAALDGLAERERDWALIDRLVAALEAGEGRG